MCGFAHRFLALVRRSAVPIVRVLRPVTSARKDVTITSRKIATSVARLRVTRPRPPRYRCARVEPVERSTSLALHVWSSGVDRTCDMATLEDRNQFRHQAAYPDARKLRGVRKASFRFDFATRGPIDGRGALGRHERAELFRRLWLLQNLTAGHDLVGVTLQIWLAGSDMVAHVSGNTALLVAFVASALS
jgi:hypothetical protein